MSHVSHTMSHVTHRDESCRTCELVLLRMWASRVAFANESCSAYRWVMSRIRMSHVTHIYWVVSHIYRVGLEWVMSHSCRGSCYTHVVTPNEWVMSYLAVLPSATSVSCIAQTAERQIYGAISVSGIWHRYYTWHTCHAVEEYCAASLQNEDTTLFDIHAHIYVSIIPAAYLYVSIHIDECRGTYERFKSHICEWFMSHICEHHTCHAVEECRVAFLRNVLTCVTRFIHTRAMTHPHMWHDSFIQYHIASLPNVT